MDTQNILSFFKRSEKLLFGVCSKLSHKFGLQAVGVRLAFVVLTFLFIPIGVIAYVGFYLAIVQNKSRMVTFGLFGALLGIPFSYYFQSVAIKNLMGMFNYLRNLSDVVDGYNGFIGNSEDIIFNIVLSIVVFTLVCGIIGYFMDKRETGK
tara:strand:- start:27442 stop:27894 length:453 start_codon:yes stop_codon:yes gene_type:complete